MTDMPNQELRNSVGDTKRLFVGPLVAALLLTALSRAADLGSSADQHTPASSDAGQRLFALRVLPLLKEKCFACHGDDQNDVRGGLSLLSREAMLAGGESGEPSIVPGDPEASLLYNAVLWEGYEMPPKENDRLTADQTELVRQWIAAGAPWPDEATQREIQQQEWSVLENDDGVIIPTSGGLSDEWTYRRYQPQDVWALQQVEQVRVDEIDSGLVHPVDFFVDRKLREAKLKAAEQADPLTLVRRATYDLTGLPPSPEQVEQFSKAWRADPGRAWEELIDRLLQSDHYGERWAQHWLDVVRYADTAGFSNDYERSNAWRYRDYVIRAFNNDKPFNEFVTEQIAGDELRPDDPEARIATGFLRMGPWGTAMIPAEEARQIYLDDLVHNVGQAFLSLPMRCCKCHDHKFDPLPTRDYYRMYAALATTQPAEVKVEFLAEENRSGFDQKREHVEELLAYAEAELAKVNQKQEAAAREWYAEHGLPYKSASERNSDPEDKKPPRYYGLSPEETGVKKVREQDARIWRRRRERFEPLAQAVYNGPGGKRDGRHLRAPDRIDQDWRPVNFILGGGALTAPLDPVTPGVPSISGPAPRPRAEDPWRITDELDGRRLALARWIASDDNTLTARSIVNRVWQHHFGRGLVKTANNFGAKGDRPTHPELLDWLTADFVEHGWRLKRLHRLIMTSDVYRRSSAPSDAERQATVDPDNKLLASFHPRRLTAEELRDSLLAVSGELNRELGGLPIMPEINMEVALEPRMIQFSIAPAHQPSRTPAERNRRTIYAYRVRGQADPFLEVMNLPNPNESCESRNTAAVTPQAFTLLNSDTMTDRSIAFALHVQREGSGDKTEWIRRAVRLAYGRPASGDEVANLHDYLQRMTAYHTEHEPEPLKYPTEVPRSLVEELTGRPFEFVEKLNAFEDYVPDAKPWTVSAETRALADVCLLLFNSNEFVYVY